MKNPPDNSWSKLLSELDGTTGWAPQSLRPIIEVNAKTVGVISDVHCPIHDHVWLAQAIITFHFFGVRDIIINGDFIDATTISSHLGEYFRRSNTLDDDLSAAESILKILCRDFANVYMTMGNHDQRLIRKLGGEVSAERIFQMLGHFKNFKITPRSFVVVNQDILVGHPRQYSKIRGKTPADLAQKIQKHIMVGHEHHSAKSVSLDGKWQAVDIPCLANLEQQDYIKNELNTYAEPLNGFSIIFGDKIVVFDRFFPWDAFKIPCILGNK